MTSSLILNGKKRKNLRLNDDNGSLLKLEQMGNMRENAERNSNEKETIRVPGSTSVYSGYSGHVYRGHSDIVATFPGTKYIYSIIFRSDIVAQGGHNIRSGLYSN